MDILINDVDDDVHDDVYDDLTDGKSWIFLLMML
jgi:hypothetical protein